jgi:hypothetical protein
VDIASRGAVLAAGVKALALLALCAVVSASVPKPPLVCGGDPKIVTVVEDAPAIFEADVEPGRVIRADGKAEYTFMDFSDTPAECALESFPPVVEDPNDFAPSPPAPIEPGYDEHDPIGPTDDGKPGAGTVDKPEAP